MLMLQTVLLASISDRKIFQRVDATDYYLYVQYNSYFLKNLIQAEHARLIPRQNSWWE